MVSLFVDGDACPVKNECIRVAARYKIKTFIVSNGGIRPIKNPLVKYVYVASNLDEADNWIETHCDRTSIVTTDDILLSKKCIVDRNLVVPRGSQIWTPTLIFLKKYFLKNIPPPQATLKYTPNRPI